MYSHHIQGRNHCENLGVTAQMVGRIYPHPAGWKRVKESENLGVTTGITFAPVDTSLI